MISKKQHQTGVAGLIPCSVCLCDIELSWSAQTCVCVPGKSAPSQKNESGITIMGSAALASVTLTI